MKIAIIQPRASYFIGGSEKISLRHAEYLSILGNNIEFYSMIHPEGRTSFLYKELKNKKIKNIKFNNFSVPQDFIDIYKETPGHNPERWHTESILFNILISEHLNIQKPDIVFSYYLPDAFFKNLDTVNIVYLGGYPTSQIDIYTSFLRLCDGIIYISKVVKDKWQVQVPSKKPTYLLPTAVDYPIDTKAIIFKKANFDIVFAGRLIERKGISDLITSFVQIKSELDDVHLWILGDGPEKTKLVNLVNKNNLQNQVTFTNIVDNPGDYFRMADLCVFPSRSKDGLMGVVLETMAVGGVAVSTIGSGSEDVITNMENGILVQPNNPESLANKIIETLKNPNLRKKIGINAEKKIKDEMTWQINSKKLNDILKNVFMKKKHG